MIIKSKMHSFTGKIINMNVANKSLKMWYKSLKIWYSHVVRHLRCVFINYNWINQLSNKTSWWLDICCLLHRYQLHVSALMAIFRLKD